MLLRTLRLRPDVLLLDDIDLPPNECRSGILTGAAVGDPAEEGGLDAFSPGLVNPLGG